MTRPARGFASLVFLALLVPAAARGQEPVSMALQINRYYGQDRALVEGAVEIPYSTLSFDQAALRADVKVEVTIQQSDGQEVYRTEHRIEPEAVSAEMTVSPRVSSIETFAIYAPPGEYVTRARVTDLRTNRSFEVSAPLVIPAARPFFSDILLTSHVQKGVQVTEATYLPFLIGNTLFSPNPRNVFFKDAELIYFYYEINPAQQEGDTAILEMTIRDGSGSVVKQLGERKVAVRSEQNFDLGAFSISGFVPGGYVLQLRCLSCPDVPVAERPFEVRAPIGPAAFAIETTPQEAVEPRYYADLTPAQVDSVVSLMSILFTPEQRNLVSTLTHEGKVRFLNRFWDSADTDPATPENEFKAAFEQRVAYADQFFASSQRRGHQTDRGRFFILFGEPTERIERPVEATVGAYAIWNYSRQGVTLAFGDFRNDGDYRLIYSNDPRYPGDPTIQSQVDRQADVSGESFLPGTRGYTRIIEDIRRHRLTTGYQR